jgi:hypothetical protein
MVALLGVVGACLVVGAGAAESWSGAYGVDEPAYGVVAVVGEEVGPDDGDDSSGGVSDGLAVLGLGLAAQLLGAEAGEYRPGGVAGGLEVPWASRRVRRVGCTARR